MPYKVRCKECKEFIYILEIMEQKTNYPCPSCNSEIVFEKQSSKLFGVEEIKVEDFPNYEHEVMKTTLSHKYTILEIYKFFVVIFMGIGTISCLFVLLNNYKSFGSDNLIVIYTLIIYSISMFSLYCVIKIIEFLFDLDKKTDNNV